MLAMAALLAAFAVAGAFEDDELTLQQREYCQMVHDWQISRGERGWPDFYGTYNTECPKGE